MTSTIKHKADDHGVGMKTVVYRWSGCGLDNAIEPLALRGAKPLSFQVIGDFAGAVARMIGSLDEKTWDVLSDTMAIPVELRRTGLGQITGRSQFIAPSIKGGGDKTKLTFLLMVEMPQ